MLKRQLTTYGVMLLFVLSCLALITWGNSSSQQTQTWLKGKRLVLNPTQVHAASATALLSSSTFQPNTSPSISTNSANKVIYLTFDMDMNGFMYRKTLATGEKWYNPAQFIYLEQNHTPATFFVSGLFATTYPDLIRNLASTAQFSFQNHSYDESSFIPHCYWLTTLKSAQAKVNQITETENIIRQETGQTATYFRFPGVCHSATDNALVRSLGYTINDGSDISGDPFNHNTKAIVRAVLSGAKSGATIIMHVGGHNAPESLAALEQIVPKLEAEGYVFKKL